MNSPKTHRAALLCIYVSRRVVHFKIVCVLCVQMCIDCSFLVFCSVGIRFLVCFFFFVFYSSILIFLSLHFLPHVVGPKPSDLLLYFSLFS